jgi:hypothetical protein
MRKFKKIGILGYGEVGQAIAKFYKNYLVKDLARDDGLDGVEILHVCIPYDKNFIDKKTKKRIFYNYLTKNYDIQRFLKINNFVNF